MFNILKDGIFSNTKNARPKVLVIEDDFSLIELLESLFGISAIDFHIYQDAEDIKSLVLKHQPNVILLDYLLPSTNGGDLCHQLKLDYHTSAIPVIIYSAVSKQLLPIDEFHCDCFIEKPFDLDFLLQKINYYGGRGAVKWNN